MFSLNVRHTKIIIIIVILYGLLLIENVENLVCCRDDDPALEGDSHFGCDTDMICADGDYCMIEQNKKLYFKKCVGPEMFNATDFCNKTTTQCNMIHDIRHGLGIYICCCQTDKCNGGFSPQRKYREEQGENVVSDIIYYSFLTFF